MTNAPYLLPGARAGYRIGDQKVVELDDARRADVRRSPVARWDWATRALQRRTHHAPLDKTSSRARSHNWPRRRSRRAKFAEEIVAVPVSQRKGDPILVATDEGVRGENGPPSHWGALSRRLRKGRHDHRRQRVADLGRLEPPSS